MVPPEKICPACGQPSDPAGTESSSCPHCGRTAAGDAPTAVRREPGNPAAPRPARWLMLSSVALAAVGSGGAVMCVSYRSEVTRVATIVAGTAKPGANPAGPGQAAVKPGERAVSV